MRVYVCLSDYSIEAVELLKTKFDVTVRSEEQRPNEKELCQLIREYDCLIIGAREKLTDTVYGFAKDSRKKIGTLSIGSDHISKSFLNNPKMKIITCTDSNVISVVEHTFAFILCLSKKILISNNAVLDNSGRAGLGGLPKDLFKHTIGVIGAGRIGTNVIKYANCFGMKTLCYTREPQKHSELHKYEIEFVTLVDLLSQSDFITIHLPLNDETKNILNSKNLPFIRNTAYLINTSRAALIDNKFLAKMLSSKKIAGFAVDIDNEDREIIKLFDGLNVIFSPHTAGVTIDAINRMDMEIAKKLTND
ncbi:MAG: NAD(P)-binding domain-containing protein [Candidatus Cloacimonetes bacterium]|nr:NAD(P)-binding domain-containing protein [Candidatus Cloacimonadota bacterium]